MNDKQAIEFFNSLVEEFGEAIPECKLIIDDKPLRKGVWGFYRQSTNSIHINRMAMELVGDDYKMVIIHEMHTTFIISFTPTQNNNIAQSSSELIR